MGEFGNGLYPQLNFVQLWILVLWYSWLWLNEHGIYSLTIAIKYGIRTFSIDFFVLTI